MLVLHLPPVYETCAVLSAFVLIGTCVVLCCAAPAEAEQLREGRRCQCECFWAVAGPRVLQS